MNATIREVARSVDVTPDLVPVLGELFAPLAGLGSSPARLATLLGGMWIGEEPLGPSHRVLDLACGKGAVGVELAKRFACRVVGVDGCEAFIADAGRLAAASHVEERCRWIVADVRRWTAASRFHVAMMIGLDGVLDAAPVLRRMTRVGGLYVVDDAVLDDTHPDADAFAGAPTAAECVRAIEALGDTVERRVLLPKSAVAAQSRAIVRKLTASAARIAAKSPKLKRSLHAFLARQRGASALLTGPLRPTIWVVRRGR